MKQVAVNNYLYHIWYHPFFILVAVSADEYIVGGMFLKTRYHRTCIRMGEKEYRMLRKKSADAGMTMNKWLMKQLTEHPPICFREKEMAEYIDHLHRAGVEINAIAKDFNSGYGTEAQMDRLVEILKEVHTHVHKVRKMGFPKAS